MYERLENNIQEILKLEISKKRKEILEPMIESLQQKLDLGEEINLNFICTHNSRRSHLGQIWAKVAARYYGISKVNCYSGGTEVTAMYPLIGYTLERQGMEIIRLSKGDNPIWAVKFDPNGLPIIAFSKKFDSDFNPSNNFNAIMTCSSADEACPIILGADERLSVTYEDPKAFDDSDTQKVKYLERSEQIAREMFFVFENLS